MQKTMNTTAGGNSYRPVPRAAEREDDYDEHKPVLESYAATCDLVFGICRRFGRLARFPARSRGESVGTLWSRQLRSLFERASALREVQVAHC